MSARRCEAVINARATEWGFRPVLCQQQVGVRLVIDAAGIVRGACTRDGHEASVIRRFGRYAGEFAADELAAIEGHAEAVRP